MLDSGIPSLLGNMVWGKGVAFGWKGCKPFPCFIQIYPKVAQVQVSNYEQFVNLVYSVAHTGRSSYPIRISSAFKTIINQPWLDHKELVALQLALLIVQVCFEDCLSWRLAPFDFRVGPGHPKKMWRWGWCVDNSCETFLEGLDAVCINVYNYDYYIFHWSL